MPGQGGIDLIENAGTNHEGLAETALLSGVAVMVQRPGQVVLLKWGASAITAIKQLVPQPWPVAPTATGSAAFTVWLIPARASNSQRTANPQQM